MKPAPPVTSRRMGLKVAGSTMPPWTGRSAVANEVPDIDALVAQLQAKVEERRRAGFYPPGLEEDLTAHARRMLHYHTRMRPEPELRTHLQKVEAALPFDASRIPAISG